MLIHDLTFNEIEAFKNTTSEKEWDALCDRVKQARNGQYPNNWYSEIVASGLMENASSKWGGTDEIDISSF